MLYRFEIIFVRQFSLFSEQFRISPGKGGLLFSLFCRSVRQAAAVLICKSSIEHTVSIAVFLAFTEHGADTFLWSPGLL